MVFPMLETLVLVLPSVVWHLKIHGLLAHNLTKVVILPSLPLAFLTTLMTVGFLLCHVQLEVKTSCGSEIMSLVL